MREVRLSSSIPVTNDLPATSRGIRPTKLPTPTDGSSTMPPLKPRRCAACHMKSTTSFDVK